jgi:predicted ATP-grasp superfamily ATP-dependent carboligase
MSATAATVLVTDGEHRAALAVVRSLGRAGYRVIVASSHRRSLAGSSRYAAHALVVPDALAEPHAFAHAVVEASRRFTTDVVLPITDPALRCLLPVRGALSGTIPFGDEAVVRQAADKPAVLRLGATLGIHVPRQIILSTPGPIVDTALDGISWPIVVKPGSSVSDGPHGQIKLGVSWARDADELRAVTSELPPAAYPVLLQERIQGPGIGVFLLRWNGKTIARFAHMRIREKPPSGGVSVCCVSAAPERDLVLQAESLLAALDWQGPAMVEFKRDVSTGAAYLMEINGRFWGSLQLAVDAGVDFPRLLVDAALGRIPVEIPTWRTGVRLRWWWGEVDHMIARLRRPDDPGPRGGRVDAMRTFMLGGWGSHNEVFRWHDPRPALRETLDWFGSIRHHHRDH